MTVPARRAQPGQTRDSGLCAVEGCERARTDRQWCHGHYEQWRRSGGTVVPSTPFLDTPEKRFWAKVEKTGECWLWIGGTNGRGDYGTFRIGRRHVPAHRVAYEWLVGPIPQGLDLDHLCRVTLCVNPAHLEPVTHKENLRRGNWGAGINGRKTHCIYGHPFAETVIFKANGWRRCGRCEELWTQARRRGYYSLGRRAALLRVIAEQATAA